MDITCTSLLADVPARRRTVAERRTFRRSLVLTQAPRGRGRDRGAARSRGDRRVGTRSQAQVGLLSPRVPVWFYRCESTIGRLSTGRRATRTSSTGPRGQAARPGHPRPCSRRERRGRPGSPARDAAARDGAGPAGAAARVAGMGRAERMRTSRLPTTGGWPLEGTPTVEHAFDPPDQPWLPGHRGVDLEARPGQRVLAPADGRVVFVGTVGGKPVVVIDHGGVRSTFEPVEASVRVGPARSPGAGDRAGRARGALPRPLPALGAEARRDLPRPAGAGARGGFGGHGRHAAPRPRRRGAQW